MAGLGAWPLALVLTQLSHALTFAAHHAACIDLVHRHFPGRLRGRGQALYTILGYGISGVLGGVGGGWLIDHLGFASAFWAAAVVALVAWVCAWRAQAAAAPHALSAGPDVTPNAAPHAQVAAAEATASENRS